MPNGYYRPEAVVENFSRKQPQHLKIQDMFQPEIKKSFVIKYLGPMIPLGFAGFGIWLLITGQYVFRPGRNPTEVVLERVDIMQAR
jgi:hypothetical protein